MRLLLVTVVLAVAFVFATGTSLPPVVASHFIAGGAANGFMSRDAYLRFTLTLLVGLPLLIAFLSSITTILPASFINLPNREYWLAPERQADTLSYIRNQGFRLGVILAIFVSFVHWLVLQANVHSPPLFPEPVFFVGMAVFLIAVITWLGGFIVHFWRRP